MQDKFLVEFNYLLSFYTSSKKKIIYDISLIYVPPPRPRLMPVRLKGSWQERSDAKMPRVLLANDRAANSIAMREKFKHMPRMVTLEFGWNI